MQPLALPGPNINSIGRYHLFQNRDFLNPVSVPEKLLFTGIMVRFHNLRLIIQPDPCLETTLVGYCAQEVKPSSSRLLLSIKKLDEMTINERLERETKKRMN